jgi:hypothetical protein
MTTTSKPARKNSLEIHIPLIRRDDSKGGDYYVSVDIDIDQNVNLGDYKMLILLGKREGSHPEIIMRARDFDTERPSQ